MSDFNKDEYLNDLPDMDNLSGQTAPSGTGPAADDAAAGAPESAAADTAADSAQAEGSATAANAEDAAADDNRNV